VHQRDLGRHPVGRLGEPLEGLPHLRGLRRREAVHEAEVEEEEHEEDHALGQTELAVAHEREEEERQHEHDRDLAFDDPRCDIHRTDQRGQAHDEADVREVRSHHVAHGEVGVAVERGDEGHDQLGRRGAEGDDREPYHDRRDAERGGQA